MIKKQTYDLVRSSMKAFVDNGIVEKNEVDEIILAARKNNSEKQKPTTPLPQCLSRKEAAKILAISLRGIDRLVADGLLKSRKLGKRRVGFLLKDINDFLENA